ncbi:MAG: replication-associated recombination protein A [Candidatus Woesebacteria bacterium]
MNNQPLAERSRPKDIKSVIGQSHILAEGKLLRELIRLKQPFSAIFWGPPGSGKTTLARIIANELEADFIELSAVTAKKTDVNNVAEQARINQNLGVKTILFVDEIHRFNKAQQDAFLPHVESGLIALIGATTENPSFEVITPLLSRSRVIVLKPHSKKDIIAILKRAAKSEGILAKFLPAKTLDIIAECASGDARVALGIFELAWQISGGKKITTDAVKNAAQKQLPGYDKAGEQHYNLISAFIKSMRGSDANATLYYLARILQTGEDPKFVARRMIVFASEDIGLEAPAALNLAVSTFLAIERLGMPECQYNLFHCATVLAKCKKSRSITKAMNKAIHFAQQLPNEPVPNHLRNAPTKLMKDLGYGNDYKWETNFKHKKGFLPDTFTDIDLFCD